MRGEGSAPASDLSQRPAGWNAAEMNARDDWRLSLRGVAGLEDDLETLERWRARASDPVAELRRGLLDTPAICALAEQASQRIRGEPGLAWLRDAPPMSAELLELFYLTVGLEFGETVDTYGRLYTVKDHGGSYKQAAIPVSQTRESTGIHTDSSNIAVWPSVVGLACVRPSPTGGGSRLVSVARASALLRETAPDAFAQLQGKFVRDVVTPGSDRSVEAVRANSFPVLFGENGEQMRYMRYWIEKGHERAGMPLSDAQREAFDALDELLADPSLNLRFELRAGDLLFLDNRAIAHDRDAYVDDPEQPRHLLRLWLEDRPHDAPGAGAGSTRSA